MISWAHEPCGGTGKCLNPSRYRESDPCSPQTCNEKCPGPHVGPFLVDGKEVWADPEKVVFRHTVDPGYGNIGHFVCGDECGYHPIGDRLVEVSDGT